MVVAVKEFLRKNLLASVATQKDGKVVYHKPVAEFLSLLGLTVPEGRTLTQALFPRARPDQVHFQRVQDLFTHVRWTHSGPI